MAFGGRILEPPRTLDPQVRMVEHVIENRQRIGAQERLAPEPMRLVGGTGQPAFGSGWSAVGGEPAPGFYRHHSRVYLHGAISGTLNTIAFTLPVGYRPSGTLWFPIVSNGTLGYLYVNSSGHVVPNTGVNGTQRLNGVSFRL